MHLEELEVGCILEVFEIIRIQSLPSYFINMIGLRRKKNPPCSDMCALIPMACLIHYSLNADGSLIDDFPGHTQMSQQTYKPIVTKSCQQS